MSVTETLTIRITEKGATITAKKVEKVAKSATELNQALEIGKKIWNALSTAMKVATGIMDDFTNMQNRLSLVTFSTGNLARVTRDLARVATETRQEFAHTADVYSRVALSVQQLGRTQSETLKFVENLNKAIVLSGASAIEANNGMIQLAQGLASNRLSGDELRSVLEQLPKVADLIAKHLNVTRGALREMGRAGKLEAEVVFDAIRLGDNEVKAFDSTNATFAQTLTQVKNQLTLWVGELDRSLGITKTLTKFMYDLVMGVADYIRKVVTAISKSEILRDVFDGLAVAAKYMVKHFKMITSVIVALIEVIVEITNWVYKFAKAASGVAAIANAMEKFKKQSKGAAEQLSEVDQAWLKLQDDRMTTDQDPLGISFEEFQKRTAGVPGGHALDAKINAIYAEYKKRIKLDGEAFAAAEKHGKEIDKLMNKQKQQLEIARAGSDVDKAQVTAKHQLLDALGLTNIAMGDAYWQQLKILEAGAKEIALLKEREDKRKKYASERNEAVKALEQYKRSLDSVYAANGQLRDSEEMLDKAVKFHLITREAANALHKKEKESLIDSLHPLAKVVDELNKEREALFLSNSERERRLKIEQAMGQLRGTSFENDPTILSGIEDLATAYYNVAHALAFYNKVKETAIGLMDKERERQEAGRKAVLDEIQAAQDRAMVERIRESAGIRSAYVTEKILELQRKQIAITPEVLNAIWAQGDALQRQAEAVKKTSTFMVEFTRVFADQFVKSMTDSLVEWEWKFDDFAKNMLRSLTELLLKWLLFKAVTGLGGSDTFATAAIGRVPTWGATGGTFQVPGSGGPDSQVALIRTSPGETVTVNTPSQQREAESGGSGGGAPQVNVILDPRVMQDSFHTAAFGDAIIEHIRRNPAALKRALRTRG